MLYITLLLFLFIPLSMFAIPAKETIRDNAIKIDHLDQLPEQMLPLFTTYKIFLIGEIHGTKESPSFCLGVIRMLAANKKTPILLALEVSEAEQPIFDEFMRTGNRQVFVKSNLFTDQQQHGISSEAMVQLLSSLRNIDNVRVVCSLSKDLPLKAAFPENQEERDLKWTSIILTHLCSKDSPRIVVLGGSFHMSLIPHIIAKLPVKTMGYYLLHSKECPLTSTQILSIDIKSKEVNAWGCFATSTSDDINIPLPTRCEEMNLSNPDNYYSTALNWDSYFLMETPMQEGYNATLFIRKLSASKPFLPTK